jgi:GNAT superfamily N-acetyltransferase
MSSTERKWLIRVYRDGDEEGILDLWKAVYPERTYERRQWTRWWQWMYRDNPNGMGVILLAEHDGRIVAHTAEIPVMMKIGSENVLGGINLDAMTHPDYRRQGTFVALVKARRLESEKRGIRATYGFRNKFSYPYPGLATKVGMFDGATLQKVLRPLDWHAALRTQTQNKLLLTIGPAAGGLLSAVFFRPRKTPLPEGMAIAQVSRFDERVDELWKRVSSQYQAAVLRDKEYLNWRYVAVPDRHYSIYIAARSDTVAGYLVLSRIEADNSTLGIVVDLLAESGEAADGLISAAVERCRQEKAALVWSGRIAGTPLAAAYRRNGFLAVPFAKSIGIKGWSNSPSIARQLQDPKNWFLQMGDSDEA